MATLFTAILSLAKVLGYVRSSTTTGAGTTTTLVDSTRTEVDDFWNDGTLFITSGTYANNSRKITDFVKASGTFTFSPALAGAPGSGVSYSVINGDWPREMLMQFVNQALQEFGSVPSTDVSLTTIKNTSSYTLPSGVYNVKRVEIGEDSSDAYPYIPWLMWREIGGKIEFDGGIPDEGKKIRLWYEAPHAEVTSDASSISNYVDLQLLVWSAAVHAWRWRLQRVGGDRPMFVQMFNEAVSNRNNLLAQTGKIKKIRKTPRVPLL